MSESDESRPPQSDSDETRTMHVTPNDETSAGVPAPAPAPVADLAGMPEEVDGYRIMGVLGQGGMGVVYLAEQKEPRRRVALKVIRGSAYTDSLHVRLFRREAETLGRLRHPNIGAIYGAGRLPDGRPYFAMELVEGPTLDAYLAARPSPAQHDELIHRITLAERIAEAVNYAHQRGVIHRDLKPSNIVIPVATDGSSASITSSGLPDVKVLDFGLARITDDDSQVSMMSDVGAIRGTLPYMSPEQVRGDTLTLDVRSDVYTLGVILYEMLAGERPYDVSRVSLPEAMRIISQQEPKALRDTPSGLKHVDTDLRAIVMKALAKEPERRYASAIALAEDLSRYRRSQPVLAQPPSAAYQLRKLISRHKPLVVAAGLALMAIVVSAIVSTAMYFKARTEAAKAQQVAEFLGDMLQGAGPSVARGRDATLLREILDRTSARVKNELSGQPDVAAGIEHVLAQTYLQIGDLAAAHEHARSAYEAHRKLRRAPHADLAGDLSVLSEIAWQRGRMAEADSLGNQALTMWRALYKGPHEETAAQLVALGSIKLDASDMAAAESLIREGLAMGQGLHAGGDRSVATALNALGNVMHYSGRFDQADSLQRLALAMHTKLSGELSPDVVNDLLNMGMVATDRGQLLQADSLIRVGITRAERIYTDPHPVRVAALIGLSNVYIRTGAFAQAESLAKQALVVARGIRGGGESPVGDALSSLGVLTNQMGRDSESLEYNRQALDAFRRAGDVAIGRTASTLDNLAGSLAGLGQFEAADSAYREAIALKIATAGPTNPTTLLSQNNYARMKYFLGDVTAAETLFREVLVGRRATLGDSSDQVAVSLSDLARTRQARGQLVEAESLLTQATAIVRARLGIESMNTNFVYGSLGRVHRELGKYALAEREFREARTHLAAALGATSPDVIWLDYELAAALGANGPSREADSLFAALANAPTAPLPPSDMLRLHLLYGQYLANTARYAQAEKYLLLAEEALRDPRESRMRRRLDVLNSLVELERAWGKQAPSAARAAALKRWTALRDAEAPELTKAIAEGRPPQVHGGE